MCRAGRFFGPGEVSSCLFSWRDDLKSEPSTRGAYYYATSLAVSRFRATPMRPHGAAQLNPPQHAQLPRLLVILSVQRRAANTYGSARRQTGQLPRRPCKPSISAGNSAMNTPPHCRCPRLPRGVGHAPRAPQLARGVAQMSSRSSMLLALAGAISRRGVPLTCVYACRSRARRP